MNPYFTNTIDLVAFTKARAGDVEANFSAVETGFDGVKTGLDLKAPLASPTFTGAPSGPTAAPGTSTTQFATTSFVATGYATIASPTFTGAPAAPTAAPGTSSTQLATTEFVMTQAFSAALPAQAGNAGKFVTTDGSTASWSDLYPVIIVSGTTQTAVAGNQYTLTNVAATTVTLPAAPAVGDKVIIKTANGLETNVVDRNGNTIEGIAENMTIDSAFAVANLQYLNGSWRLV